VEVLQQNTAQELVEITVLANLQLAVVFMDKNEWPKSITLLEKCVITANGLNLLTLQIETNVYGNHFYLENDTQKAKAFIYKALQIAQQLHDKYWQAYCLMHLGTLNTILNNNDVALTLFSEAFTLFKSLELNISMADNLMCHFNIYYRKKDFEKAIANLEQAITLTPYCG